MKGKQAQVEMASVGTVIGAKHHARRIPQFPHQATI
jgi:hypothetical protein